MDLAVKDAAARLGVSPARVRQLLNAGRLEGRQVGREWLISDQDVARLQGQSRRPGRPLGPQRAWGLLDLLEGGSAPWLSYSARSQLRASMAKLVDADADQWRNALRGRSDELRMAAHPAAVSRLVGADHVLAAGVQEAARRDFDLVALEEPVREVYVAADAWPSLKQALAIREASQGGNLLVRIPKGLWPFRDAPALPDAVLAADLLDSAEPRAVRAGHLKLSSLLQDWMAR